MAQDLRQKLISLRADETRTLYIDLYDASGVALPSLEGYQFQGAVFGSSVENFSFSSQGNRLLLTLTSEQLTALLGTMSTVAVTYAVRTRYNQGNPYVLRFGVCEITRGQDWSGGGAWS